MLCLFAISRLHALAFPVPFVFLDLADALLFSILILHFFIACDTRPTVARIAKISAFSTRISGLLQEKYFPCMLVPVRQQWSWGRNRTGR
jgi:hypothetical protein